MNFSQKKYKFLLGLLLLYSFPFWSQNVKVELTFTYSNSILKTFTVGDLKIINLPAGASASWYDALTGGAIVPTTTPLVNGQRYYLETIPKAAIGTRLQTIVYEVAPYIAANKSNPVCTGDQITLTANNLLATEQFTNDNTNGKGLNLKKITQFGTSTYFIKQEKMSWENANTLITAIPGASMYMINSTAEENAVYAALQTQGLTGNDNIALWLGLKQYANATDYSDTANQGGWYWIDGTPLGYANWGTGEPNDYKSATQLYDTGGIHDEDYGQFEFLNLGKRWNDAPNDSTDRNSYPIFEFTATSALQWYKYNYLTNTYDLLSGQEKDVLIVSAAAGKQKYKLTILVNGTVIEKEYEIDANKPQAFPVSSNLTTSCDDDVNSLNQDGKTNFNTATFDSTVLGSQTDVVVKYFDQNNGALASPLPNPFSTISQIITARVEKSTDASCFSTTNITFFVHALPKINNNTGGSEDVYVCKDQYPKNISLNAGIQDGTPTTDYTYNWFINGTPIPNENNPTYDASAIGSYSVQVTSKATGCSSTRKIKYSVINKPQIFSLATNLTTVCDDEQDPELQDGQFSFDTTKFQNALLGNQTGMQIQYTDQAGNSLPSPLPNPFVSTTQNITAIVTNSLSNSCNNSGSIPLIVKPLPRIRINADDSENVIICSNISLFTDTLTAGISDGSPLTDYDFVWYKDGIIIPAETNSTLTVTDVGQYSVGVKFKNSACFSVRNITVTHSDTPKIISLDIHDLSQNNSVTINAEGKGKYQYSISGFDGYFQDSNVFKNIEPGIYTAIVKDLNKCGFDQKPAFVIGAPPFFTPNGDGYNDYWSIKGLDATTNFTALSIYDQWGKLIKQINPTDQGWDGTLNGFPVPANDYWFTLVLPNGREAKGHFSLKR